MPIEFACSQCTKTVRVPNGSEGKKCKCPQCQTILNIPHDEPFVQVELLDQDEPEAIDEPTETDESEQDELLDIEIKLEVPCPRCQHVLVCNPELEGTRGLCPSCKHIFTIIPAGSETHEEPNVLHLTFPFQCPHCKQLFEGKPGMLGRKGKCISCHQVFEIVKHLEPAKSAAPSTTAEADIASTKPSSKAPLQDAESHDGSSASTHKLASQVPTEPVAQSGPSLPELKPLEPIYKPTTSNPVPTLRRPVSVSQPVEQPVATSTPTSTPVAAPVPQVVRAAPIVVSPVVVSPMVVGNGPAPTAAHAAVDSTDWMSSIPTESMLAASAPVNPYVNHATIATPARSSSFELTGSASASRKKYLKHESNVKGIGMLYAIGTALLVAGSLLLVVIVILASMGNSSRISRENLMMGTVAILIGAAAMLGAAVFIASVSFGLFRLNLYGRICAVILTVFHVLSFAIRFLLGCLFMGFSLFSPHAHVTLSLVLNGVVGLMSNAYFCCLFGYIFYVLLSPNAGIVFSKEYRSIVQQTPNVKGYVPPFVWITLCVVFAEIGVLIATTYLRYLGY
jgi:hypothetical protein